MALTQLGFSLDVYEYNRSNVMVCMYVICVYKLCRRKTIIIIMVEPKEKNFHLIIRLKAGEREAAII